MLNHSQKLKQQLVDRDNYPVAGAAQQKKQDRALSQQHWTKKRESAMASEKSISRKRHAHLQKQMHRRINKIRRSHLLHFATRHSGAKADAVGQNTFPRKGGTKHEENQNMKALSLRHFENASITPKNTEDRDHDLIMQAKKKPRVEGVCFDRFSKRWVAKRAGGRKVYFPVYKFGFHHAYELAVHTRKKSENDLADSTVVSSGRVTSATYHKRDRMSSTKSKVSVIEEGAAHRHETPGFTVVRNGEKNKFLTGLLPAYHTRERVYSASSSTPQSFPVEPTQSAPTFETGRRKENTTSLKPISLTDPDFHIVSLASTPTRSMQPKSGIGFDFGTLSPFASGALKEATDRATRTHCYSMKSLFRSNTLRAIARSGESEEKAKEVEEDKMQHGVLVGLSFGAENSFRSSTVDTKRPEKNPLQLSHASVSREHAAEPREGYSCNSSSHWHWNQLKEDVGDWKVSGCVGFISSPSLVQFAATIEPKNFHENSNSSPKKWSSTCHVTCENNVVFSSKKNFNRSTSKKLLHSRRYSMFDQNKSSIHGAGETTATVSMAQVTTSESADRVPGASAHADDVCAGDCALTLELLIQSMLVILNDLVINCIPAIFGDFPEDCRCRIQAMQQHSLIMSTPAHFQPLLAAYFHLFWPLLKENLLPHETSLKQVRKLLGKLHLVARSHESLFPEYPLLGELDNREGPYAVIQTTTRSNGKEFDFRVPAFGGGVGIQH